MEAIYQHTPTQPNPTPPRQPLAAALTLVLQLGQTRKVAVAVENFFKLSKNKLSLKTQFKKLTPTIG